MTLLRRAARSIKLPDRLPLTSSSWSAQRFGGMLGQPSNGYGLYSQIGALYGVSTRIAEAVSLTEWNLYEQLASGERNLLDDATAPARHPATALWTHPNPWESRQSLLHLSDLYMSLAGEVFWLIAKRTEDGPAITAQSGVQTDIELWAINPTRIQPVPDRQHYIAGYLYQNGPEKIPIDAKYIVQMRVPDPNNPWRGMGPVQPLAVDLDAERLAMLYERNFLNNDARPGGVISYPDAMSDTDWNTQIERWREQHQGVSNVARIAMLERGGKFEPTTYNNREMQWDKLRQTHRDNTFLPFGMHAAIMGLSEHINRANAETARADFALWLLKPRLERYKSALNERVLPFIGDALTMDYVDPTPDDRAVIVNEAMSLWGWGVQTLNQTLEALGQEAVEDPRGDQYIYEVVPTQAPSMPKAPPTVPDPMGSRGMLDLTVKRDHETLRAELIEYLRGATNGVH